MQETSVVETQVPAAVTNEVAGSERASHDAAFPMGGKLTRDELAQVPTPAGTATHKPIPHIGGRREAGRNAGFSPDRSGSRRVRGIQRRHADVRRPWI